MLDGLLLDASWLDAVIRDWNLVMLKKTFPLKGLVFAPQLWPIERNMPVRALLRGDALPFPSW